MNHEYLSTACYHGLHLKCGEAQRERGETGLPHCKFCAAFCVCTCHHLIPGARTVLAIPGNIPTQIEPPL